MSLQTCHQYGHDIYVMSGWQDLAYILATGYVAMSILLSGFLLRPSQLTIDPLLWLSYVSYPRYTTFSATQLSMQNMSHLLLLVLVF